MSTLQENIERYKLIEKKVQETKSQADAFKAKSEVHKDNFQKAKTDLAEKRNITFENGRELQEIYHSKLERFTELLDHAEEISGIKKEEDDMDSFFK